MTTSSYEVPILDTYHAVVLAFSDFLTVAIHTILYERNIYPRTSFFSARKYNYPVKQSRHPKVCKWIQDAVAAIESEMLKCTIANTSLIIHSPTSLPLERYLFSTISFPRIPSSEHLTPFDFNPSNSSDSQITSPSTTNKPQISPATLTKRFNPPPTSDLPEQFRATLARLSSLSSTLVPLPPDCSFTVAIELRDEMGVDPPIGHPQPWIAAEPGLQKERGKGAGSEETGMAEKRGGDEDGDGDREGEPGKKSKKGSSLGGVKMTPVRNLEAGAFVMEVWVEEGKAKFEETEGTDGHGQKQKGQAE